MSRFHALDGMTVFVHVEDTAPHREGIKRIGAQLPGFVKRGRVGRVANDAEALPAAHVVHAIHAVSSA
jgi:hypothetical protein